MEFTILDVEIDLLVDSHPEQPFMLMFCVEYQDDIRSIAVPLSKDFERCVDLYDSWNAYPSRYSTGSDFNHTSEAKSKQFWLEVERQIDPLLKQQKTVIKNRLFQRAGIYVEEQDGRFELYYETNDHSFHVGCAENLVGLHDEFIEDFFDSLRGQSLERLSAAIDFYHFNEVENYPDFSLDFSVIDEIALLYLDYTTNDIRKYWPLIEARFDRNDFQEMGRLLAHGLPDEPEYREIDLAEKLVEAGLTGIDDQLVYQVIQSKKSSKEEQKKQLFVL